MRQLQRTRGSHHRIVTQRTQNLSHRLAHLLPLCSDRRRRILPFLALLGVGGIREGSAYQSITPRHPIRVRRHLVVIHHRPLIERMIMTLRANHLRPQKHLRRHRHVVELHVVIPNVKPHRPVVVGLALRRDQFLHHHVIRLVRRKALLQPVRISQSRRQALPPANRGALQTQHIRPKIEVVLLIPGRRQQLIDQFHPLIRRRVRQKRLRLLQ